MRPVLPAPLEIPNCAIAAEFLRQINEGEYDINLTQLWNWTGRTRKLKPIRWARSHRKAGCRPVHLHSWSKGAVTATGAGVAWYLFDCDHRLEDAYHGYYRIRYRDAAIQAVISEPSPLIAALAVCDLVIAFDEAPIAVAEWIMNGAVDAVRHLDPLTQESVVANVQRAFRNEPHPPTRYELYGHQEI